MRTTAGSRTVAILGFHKIGEPPPGGWETWFYIREQTYLSQLRYLQQNGWQVIDLGTFLRGLTDPWSLPERAALLTFDDGYRSIGEAALSGLVQFGYPGVLFVPTAFIGGRNSFDGGREPDEAIGDWDDLRELQRCGVSIQSHGVSHRAFSELSLAEQEEELIRSRATLEEGLGRSVEMFSYPYGDAGRDPQGLVRVLERAGYRAACLYGGGPISFPITQPYHLARLAMGRDTDLQTALKPAEHAATGERAVQWA
jgi:peptidoglycan/xylan/chitin deacetylase (PgdA/CDA1 family)